MLGILDTIKKLKCSEAFEGGKPRRSFQNHSTVRFFIQLECLMFGKLFRFMKNSYIVEWVL